MKRIVVYLLAFSIVYAAVAGACYFLSLFISLIFNQDWFTDWREYVIIGLAGAIAGLFGPVLSARIENLFKK